MKLWVKILIGLVIGVFTGHFFGEKALVLEPIGTIFMNLINMLIGLLVLASMTIGVTSIHDPKKLGRVGLKTILLYVTTTAIAIVIGITFAKVFQPGLGAEVKVAADFTVPESKNLKDILLDAVPSNPVLALVNENMLQIIIFALFLGIAINFAGEKGRPLRELLESLADVMYRLTSIVMEFAPYGVFAIMAATVGNHGVGIVVNLMKLLLTFYSACLVHAVVVFGFILWFMARLKPMPFFRGMSDAVMVAFGTASSSAALPVSMHCAQENLGVSKNISSFVLPLGSTVNMNGAGLYQGMAVLFIAQAYGIELSWAQLGTVVVTATLSAIGAAGIPGSGYIMLNAVFSAVGFPTAWIPILLGIDRIREMGSTVLNILGDTVCAVYIAKQEGELDERQYYHEELVELEGSDI